jgi:predicted  nucleic acid-binding Zn-ribbon protein
MGEKEALQKKMESELAKCESRLVVVKGKKGAEKLMKEIQSLEEELDACQFEIKAIERTATADLGVAEEHIVRRFDNFRKKLDRTTLKFP